MKELAIRLVNALSTAERIPRDEWYADQTRQDREMMLHSKNTLRDTEAFHKFLTEWVECLLNGRA